LVKGKAISEIKGINVYRLISEEGYGGDVKEEGCG
jgi:hypothetical protein